MIWGISWIDQQTAPRVPRMLAAVGLFMILGEDEDVRVG